MDKSQEHFNELRRLAETEDPDLVKDYYLDLGDEFEFEMEDEVIFEQRTAQLR